MGAITNCCKSQKKTDNKIDFTKELHGQEESDDDQIKQEDDMDNIGDIFKKNDIMDKYMEDNLEDASDNLDQVGYLTFDYFLKVYKTALIWNRITFAKKKTELIQKRREALKKNDMEQYHKIIQLITDIDEACLQDVVEEILKFIGMTDKQFNDSLSFHFEDPSKIDKIKEIREEAEIDQGEGLPADQREQFQKRDATMTKKEVMAAQRINQDISIELINDLKKLHPTEVQNEVRFLQFKCIDLFSIRTGIEVDDLEFSTRKLDLENDDDYKKLLVEYNEKMENMSKQPASDTNTNQSETTKSN